MNRLFTFFGKHKTISIFFLILSISFLSHGKTMQMYYWVDDWAMTYKVLWPEESPGNMGSGVFGNGGPYRYLVTPFIWLYPIFGFNATPYFVIGWIIYLLAAFTVYLLVLELTQKRPLALSAAAIFASGYIGSHALYRLTNSYQTVGATLFICLTVWLVAKYLRERKTQFYYLSLVVFWVALEIFFIRTHGLYLSILAAMLFYKLTKRTALSFKQILLGQLPFLLTFYFMYFLDPRIKIQSNLVLSGMDAIFKQGQFQLFNNYLITFANIIVPDPLILRFFEYLAKVSAQIGNNPGSLIYFPGAVLMVIFITLVWFIPRNTKKIWKISSMILLLFLYLFITWSSFQVTSLWNPRKIEIFSAILGGSLLTAFLHIGISLWQQKVKIVLFIPFALFWIFVNTLTLFIYSPETNLESTSRYLVPAFVGISILFATAFWILFQRKFAMAGITIICLTLIYFSNREADNLIQNVTIPDRQGYELIQKEVKQVNKDTIFYIESADDPRYKNNYLGRLPQLGISSLFKYHGITKIADSYPHLFALLSSGEVKVENVHTYFLGPGGYISTTSNLRKILSEGGNPVRVEKWMSNVPSEDLKSLLKTQTLISRNENRSVAISPALETLISFDSIVPAVLEMTMSLTPVDSKEVSFPYYDLSYELPPDTTFSMLEASNPKPKLIDQEDIIVTADEELEKQLLQNTAVVTATSSWKPSYPKNLVDGRVDTNWSADNNQWNIGKKPQEVFIDLGNAKQIKKILWVNHHYMSTPTIYSISTSLDGENWQKQIEEKNGGRKDGGEEVTQLIKESFARFIKISIDETYGGKGYPPAFKELWISSEDRDIENSKKEKIIACPFCLIPDAQTYIQTLASIQKISKVKLWWQTDRVDGYRPSYSKSFPVILDGTQHIYKVYLPPQGTRYKKLKIDGFQIPLKIEIKEASIRSLSFKEISELRAYWDIGE